MCKKIVTVIRKSEKDGLHFFLISKDENTEKKH